MTHIVEEIRGFCKVRNGYEILVGWLAHERDNDTWEPLISISEDIAGLIEDYLHTV